MVMKNQQEAFTLIELMIVVAIVAVLAAIAYPSYQEYVKRTNRTDIQTEMLQQAQHLQSYYVIKHNYLAAKLDNHSLTLDYPTVNAKYTLTLIPADQTWQLSAIPKGSQAGDGGLWLNSQGQKCWTKGASTCALSGTSNWDGK